MTRHARAAGLSFVFAVTACGLKSAPVAPELVQPLPPASVRAASTRTGIQLSWRRPLRYTGGGRMRDLGGFEIERAASASGPFVRVHTIALEDQQRFRPQREIEWTDADVRVGEQYAYRVIAFTLDGDHSAPSPPTTVRHTPVASAGERSGESTP